MCKDANYYEGKRVSIIEGRRGNADLLFIECF